MDILLLLLSSLAVALVAYVYSEILTAPGMLLNGWYNFAERTLKPELFKPLAGCYKCVAGQLATWHYIYNYYQTYSIQEHALYISFAIFSAILLNTLHTWTQKQ
jgi:energy-coupling factor transporter transmembrane protein EcfT